MSGAEPGSGPPIRPSAVADRKRQLEEAIRALESLYRVNGSQPPAARDHEGITPLTSRQDFESDPDETEPDLPDGFTGEPRKRPRCLKGAELCEAALLCLTNPKAEVARYFDVSVRTVANLPKRAARLPLTPVRVRRRTLTREDKVEIIQHHLRGLGTLGICREAFVSCPFLVAKTLRDCGCDPANYRRVGVQLLTPIAQETMAHFYRQGWSCWTLARVVGLSPMGVWKILRRNGVETRAKGQQRRGRGAVEG